MLKKDQPLPEDLKRNIMEPPTSTVLLGPREGFIEDVATNFALIQKRLRSEKLKQLNLKIGRHTQTEVRLVFLQDVADKNIVDLVFKKLNKIDIDGVIDSYYLVSFLEERPESIFKQVGQTEKPDVAAAKILEGRVAIIVDGSPIILTLPFVLIEDLQSPEDYYQKNIRATFVRYVRLISVFVATLLPGLYLALVLYHYKIIPLNLLVTLSNSTANLPFGPFIEILFVIVLFEVLYEANLRMPRHLGMALSIVGALILGDTAVKAGLISPGAVMVIALSGITAYTLPNETGQLSLLRLGFTFAAGMLSFYGIALFGVFVLLYLSDFNSYQSPYLAPIAPYVKSDLKDAVNKQNITNLKSRPDSIKNINKTRLKD